jgi:hypothetical protein
VGQYGGLQDEVENLKRDKNVLTAELVRLRNQQQVGAALTAAACSGGAARLTGGALLRHRARPYHPSGRLHSQPVELDPPDPPRPGPGCSPPLQASDLRMRDLQTRVERTEQRQHGMINLLARVMQDPAMLQQAFATLQNTNLQRIGSRNGSGEPPRLACPLRLFVLHSPPVPVCLFACLALDSGGGSRTSSSSSSATQHPLQQRPASRLGQQPLAAHRPRRPLQRARSAARAPTATAKWTGTAAAAPRLRAPGRSSATRPTPTATSPTTCCSSSAAARRGLRPTSTLRALSTP